MPEKLKLMLISRPVFSLLSLFLTLIFISAASMFLLERLGEGLSLIDAFFTASSAATVTGLTVVDTHSLTFVSQLVILLTIQLGGLMAVGGSAFVILLASKMGSARQGKVSASSLMGVGWTELIQTLKFVIALSFFVEVAAALALFFYFRGDMGEGQAAWYAAFHAISAFCNAGFFLFQDNLYSFAGDAFVLSVIMAEIILGGLGFLVILSIKTRLIAAIKRKRIYGWPVHAKLVGLLTVVFLLIGAGVFWGFEYTNVLAGEPLGKQMLISAFQSVSARTAGFSTVDMGEIRQSTQFFYGFLMFIGGGSISVSGGIKLTTFAVVLLSIWTRYKRKEHIVVWKRVISRKTVVRANGILLISLATLYAFMLLLLSIEKFDFEDILFEMLSAFGTVGYSSGISELLSTPSKILFSILMLIGRIGPLGLTYLFGREIMDEKILRLEEEVEVG